MNPHPVPAPLLQDLLSSLATAGTSINDSTQNTRSENPPPHRPPRVCIVGGSLGGCCAAIALASIGCDASIYERSGRELTGQGAGLVIQPDMAGFLEHFQVCDVVEVSVASEGRQYVDRSGKIIGGNASPQLFSAWDVVYRALRKKVPDSSYNAGTAVTNIDIVDGGGCCVTLEGGEQQTFDLVVGADGPGSLVRSTFCPEARSEYQGYVAWRGLIPETQAPPHVLSYLGSKFTVYQGANFHILAYLIPGAHGEVIEGQRRVNWVWYWNTKEEELAHILTDVNGKTHGYSVPRGMIRPEVAQKRREIAQEVLPPALADMVCATKDIFVQAIQDMLAPRLAFEKGRIALLGDAGCIIRPHTAAGTTKAAVNAWALARCLKQSGFDVEPALEEYSRAMVAVAERLVAVGVEIGNKSQFSHAVEEEGKVNEGYIIENDGVTS